MKSVNVELSNKLHSDIERLCSNNNKTIEEFISSVLLEKVTLLKYGDLNDIMSKLEFKTLTLEDKYIIVSTNKGDLKLKITEIKKLIPKDKPKVVIKEEDNKLTVNTSSKIDGETELSVTRKMRIL